MIRRITLLLLCLLCLASLPGRADGYWVLKKTTTGSGQTRPSKKLQWKIKPGTATLKDLGTRFNWEAPPAKIRFGEEEDLEFKIEVLAGDGMQRIPDLNEAVELMAPRAWVTVTASYTGESESFFYEQNGKWSSDVFTWRTPEARVSKTLRRTPDQDMHMDLFSPDAESILTIHVEISLFRPGGPDLDGTPKGGFTPVLWSSVCSQTYIYEWVGDAPEYNVTTTPGDTPGEQKGPAIPPAVFWIGAVAGGGFLISRLRNRKPKGKAEPRDPEESETPVPKPSSYQMILYKEFGDTLRIGDDPRVVGARIEEITAEGVRKDRPDLTEKIRIYEGQNIKILSVGMYGKYRCAEIRVPDPQTKAIPDKGTVVFSFKGPGGLLNNHVEFKIEDNLKILFCQDNVTYVAGHRSSETIYFYVEGLTENAKVEVELENDDKQTFVLSKVRPDQEGSYSVDVTDCLAESELKDRMPGDVDTCYLLVKASEPVRDGLREVKERLPLHRFYEGLRLQVGHIKAYPVVKGTESIAMTEEQPTDYEHPLAIAHTRLEVTLFAWDEKKNRIGSPAPDSMEINFEDVPESLEWFGKRKDEPIREPVVNIGLKLQDFAVDCRPVIEGINTRTYIYEIVPSAIMVPPNRCKAAIKAVATYGGRTFRAEQVSMVISMPVRIPADLSELHQMQQFDEQVREKFTHMRNVLLSRPQAPQLAALIYKCDIMLQSFDERFGFYMPEYYNAKNLFLKLMTGEVGPLYVAESAYVWEEVYFGDGFDMCMAAMAEREPKTLMGRLLLGITTLGYSEVLYYTPKRFLLECKKASENEANTFFDNFLVGAKFATREMIQTMVFQEGLKYGLTKLSTTQFGQALSETAGLVKNDLLAIESTLCKNYSSVAYVSRLARTTHKVLNWKIDVRSLCRKKLDAGKKLLEESPAMQELRDLAKEAQELGEQKVKEFIRACQDPDISPEELKSLVLSIQCDRWAKNYLNSSKVIDKYRFRFTTENTILNANVKKALKSKLAKDFGVHEDQITFFEATGNTAKVNAVNCKKVGMDHDYTIRVNGQDLPEEVASRYWNDEYCFQATGSRNFSPWDADKLGFQAEQTAVSFEGPESFRTDVGKVVDPKGTAAQTFDDAQLVQDVQTYKVEEPLRLFEENMRKAAAQTDPAWQKVFRKEALQNLREAGRQFPKGLDRTLEEKIKILEQWGTAEKINPVKLKAAQELRGRIDDMLANTGEGDSQALIEFYASYKAEGKSLAEETRKAFTLITEVDHLIGEGRGLPEIETFGLNMTGAHAVEESLKEDTQFM